METETLSQDRVASFITSILENIEIKSKEQDGKKFDHFSLVLHPDMADLILKVYPHKLVDNVLVIEMSGVQIWLYPDELAKNQMYLEEVFT